MNRWWYIGGGMLLVLVVGLVVFSNNGPGQYDDFAKCLSENDVRMFGAFWCPHCAEQKKKFGNSWEHVDYVECSTPNKQQTAYCDQQGIRGYPTWEFADGTRESRVMTLQELSQRTDCPLQPSQVPQQ